MNRVTLTPSEDKANPFEELEQEGWVPIDDNVESVVSTINTFLAKHKLEIVEGTILNETWIRLQPITVINKRLKSNCP